MEINLSSLIAALIAASILLVAGMVFAADGDEPTSRKARAAGLRNRTIGAILLVAGNGVLVLLVFVVPGFIQETVIGLTIVGLVSSAPYLVPALIALTQQASRMIEADRQFRIKEVLAEA